MLLFEVRGGCLLQLLVRASLRTEEVVRLEYPFTTMCLLDLDFDDDDDYTTYHRPGPFSARVSSRNLGFLVSHVPFLAFGHLVLSPATLSVLFLR